MATAYSGILPQLPPGSSNRRAATTNDGTVRLPYDTTTGQMIPEVWERWLRWDPVRMVPHHADALRKMAAIYLAERLTP